MNRLFRKKTTYEIPPLQGTFDQDSIYFFKTKTGAPGFLHTEKRSGDDMKKPLSLEECKVRFFKFDRYRPTQDVYALPFRYNYEDDPKVIEQDVMEIVSAVKINLSEFKKFKTRGHEVPVKNIFLALHAFAEGFIENDAKCCKGRNPIQDQNLRWGIYTLSWFTYFPRFLEEWKFGRKKDKKAGLIGVILKEKSKRGKITREVPASSINSSIVGPIQATKAYKEYNDKIYENVWRQDLKRFSEEQPWTLKIPEVKKSEAAFKYNEDAIRGIQLTCLREKLEFGRYYFVMGNKGTRSSHPVRGIIHIRDNKKTHGIFCERGRIKVITSEDEGILQKVDTAVDLRRILYWNLDPGTEKRFTKLLDILQQTKIEYKSSREWAVIALGIGWRMLPRRNTGSKIIDEAETITKLLTAVVLGRYTKESVVQWWEIKEARPDGTDYKAIYEKTKELTENNEKGSTNSQGVSTPKREATLKREPTPNRRPGSSSGSVSLDPKLRPYAYILGLPKFLDNLEHEQVSQRPHSRGRPVRRQTSIVNTATNRTASTRRALR